MIGIHATLLVVAALAPAPVSGQDVPVPVEPINEMCPVMPEEYVDPEYTVLYKGQAIGLCCSKCRRMFVRDPEQYLAFLPEFVQPGAGAPGAADGSESDATGSDGAPAETGARDGQASRWLGPLGRLHPLVVHFPIALLLAAAAAEGLYVLRRQSAARTAMRFCLALGAASGVAAALLGLAAGSGASYSGELARAFERHRTLGIATALVALACWLLAGRATREGEDARTLAVWRLLLLAGAGVLVVTAHLGGTLVYGPGYFPG